MTVFAQSGWPTLVALGAVAVMVGLMLLRVQRYYRRRPRCGPAPGRPAGAHASRPGHPTGAVREMMEWEVQMHDLAREMTGQLSSKMAALEHLIREADRAAARLEAALDRASKSGHGEEPAGSGQRDSSASTREARQEPRAPGPQGPLPAPASQADALRPAAVGDLAAGASRGEDDRSGQRPSRERRHEEVYTLADYGFDAPEIARRLATPVGEIELILSLRGKR